MDIFDIKLWAGTEQSLSLYLLQLQGLVSDGKLLEMMMKGPSNQAYGGEGESAKRPPRLLKVSGGVATIRIAGSLNNSDSWINEYIRAVGYPEIREAVVHAAQDASVKAIVLDIASGGGAVNGLADTGDLIASVDKIKPVTAFSDGAMMSAAYWLGASARHITISRNAEAGSVGVLAVQQEITKLLEKAGVTPTIFRSGKYKALGHPMEPLSELGREEIQASVDYSAGIFTQHVADRRGVSYQIAESKMGQGRVFPGERALEAGLVDAIGTFDDVIGKAQKVKSKEKIGGGIAFGNSTSQYGANSEGTAVKTALTEQQLAALAEGAGPEADAKGAAPANEDDEAAAAAAAKAAADKAAAEKEAADKAAAEKEAAEKSDKDAGGVVSYLQGQLAEANAKVTELTIQARDAKAASEALSTSHAAMRAITVASVDRLRVALGHAAGAAEAMTDAELLAAHSTLRDQFEKKFKAGGVAAVSSAGSADKDGKSAPVDPVRLARIAATRLK